MPTAARLVAALVFAITGYLTAKSVIPYLPEGAPAKYLMPVSIIFPIICGWRVVGRLIGKTYWIAINTGVYGVVVSIFFCIAAFSIGEMLKRSTRLQYDGPMEAVVSMFGISLEYGQLLLHPAPIATLVVGAVVGGIGAEWAERKWG